MSKADRIANLERALARVRADRDVLLELKDSHVCRPCPPSLAERVRGEFMEKWSFLLEALR